ANWSNMNDFPSMYRGLWAVDTTYAHQQMFRTSEGRELFSGGGIRPDIEVSIDSNAISLLYQQIVESSFIEQFVYERFTKQSPAYSIENFLQGYHLRSEEHTSELQSREKLV